MTNNYTKIIEKKGKVFLFDPDRAGTIGANLDALRSAYGNVPGIIERSGNAVTIPAIIAVAEEGAAGLQRIEQATFDQAADKLGIPPRFRASLSGTCPPIDPEIAEAADRIHKEIIAAQKALPMLDGDISYNVDDGKVKVSINEEAIADRIDALCSVEVKPEMQKEAATLRDIISRLRLLDDAGLRVGDVLNSLLGNYLAPGKRPELTDLALFTATTKRHNSREFVKASNPEKYYLLGGE